MPSRSVARTGQSALLSPAAALRAVDALCELRGARLTPLRRQILAFLLEARRPLGAYELLMMLSRFQNSTPAPTTIYRTLAFLVQQGFCLRLESRNAYVACARTGIAPGGSIVFVCDTCSAAVQVENEHLSALMDADAASLGFRIDHRVLELQGICAQCLTSDPY